MTAAMQGATALATILNTSGREGRDIATFLARQRRDEELHQRRLSAEADKQEFQRERHELTVEKNKAEIANTIDAGDRQVLLDQARGIEIANRVAKANAENNRKAALDDKRSDKIDADINNAQRITDARVEATRDGTRINLRDLRRRQSETNRRIRRDDAEHTQRIAAGNDRRTWSEAKYKAELAEIFQRMQDRHRRWGLSDELARSDSAATAGMRTAATFAAANGTREWGDRERQNAADFAERAAEDGVGPDDLIEFVRSSSTRNDTDRGPIPPEQELAEQLVVAADDARRDPDEPNPVGPAQQIRDNLDATGLTDQHPAPATDIELDQAPQAGTAATPGADPGPE